MAYTLRPLRGGFDWPACAGCCAISSRRVGRVGVLVVFQPRRGTRGEPLEPHRAKGLAPDPAFARLLMALLLSLRGSVCLYQGEELGLTEAELTLDQLRDPFGIAYWPEFRGRDGSRTPIPWRAGVPHAGFTAGGDAPWLPMPAAHHALAVDRAEADPHCAAARVPPVPRRGVAASPRWCAAR